MFEIANLPQPMLRYAVGLWRRRWLVLVAAWLAAIAAWFGIWLIPDKYESRAQIFVQTDTVLQPVVTEIAVRPEYERRVEVMQRALVTRPNLEKVIARSGLDVLIDATGERERLVQKEALISGLATDIKIESPQPMFFDIRYGFSEPALASRVVNAILDLFIEQDLGASLQENEEARRKLALQIDRFEARLAAKDQEVARFRQEHAEELAAVSGNLRRRDQLEVDLSMVSNELAIAKRNVATLRTRLANTPRVGTPEEMNKLKSELTRLRSQFHEEHPDIKVVRARIAELESGGGEGLPENPEHRATRNDLSAARNQVAALEEREAKIRADLEGVSYTTAQAPAVEAELQRIIRDYEQTQKSYEELVQSRDRLDLTRALGAGSQGVAYQVLERPRPALKPTSPPRMLLILASFIFALGVGAGTAIMLTMIDKSFSQSQSLQQAFNLPVLGSLSVSPTPQNKAALRTDLSRLGIGLLVLVMMTGFYLYWEVLRVPPTAFAPSSAVAPISAETVASL